MRLEIFPAFSVYLHLHDLIGLDLVKGYYQIRVYVKPNLTYSSNLCKEVQFSSRDDSNDTLASNSIGCSRVAKIVKKEQCVELDNAFRCKINVDKRLDKFETMLLPMEFELWYMDLEALPSENYRLVSKREVNIQLKPEKSTHCSRPIFFEYFLFSAVSISVHTSIIGLRVVRRKPGPDPPISDKLRVSHKSICSVMFAAIQSLQNFVQRFSHVLTSPIKIVTRDCTKEKLRLQKELESSRNPWAKFEQDICSFNTQLSKLFNQLLQLFSKSKELRENMLAEFDQLRMKQLSEAFLFCEDSIHSLLKASLSQNSVVLDYLKKNAYYSLISSLPINVANADINVDNMTMIIEQRFLPSNSTGLKSPNETKSGSSSHINGLDRNQALQITASPRKIFDFCLPLSALSSSRRQNEQDEEEEYMIPPNRHLSVVVENGDKRRMTDPCVANLNKSTSNLRVSDYNVDSVNAKCRSLSEISPNSKAAQQKMSSSRDSLGSNLLSSQSSSSCAELQQSSNNNVNAQLVEFVKRKESFKQHLDQDLGFQGYLCSDSAAIKQSPLTCFANAARSLSEKRQNNLGDVHLVIFVHGLEGSSEDLSAYRNYLKVALPETNLSFLLSEVNQTETWSDLRGMAQNLMDEILKHVSKMKTYPAKISLIAHSLGGLIVRAMCSLESVKPLLPKFHTLMTLNSPHCGLLYNQRAASWGISLLQWWKQSPCLEQLTFKDSLILRDNYLYRLSQNGALGLFKNVLLVGSCQDVYVPCHSALVEPCKAALMDSSGLGAVYMEMINNINECLVGSSRHTTVVKYTVSHCLAKVPRAQQVTGRAVHIATVDDDVFVEKLLMVSAAKYFK